MEKDILVLDDDVSFLHYLEQKAHQKGLERVVFLSSYREASDYLKKHRIRRIIADMFLEGEEETGIDLLAEAGAFCPETDRYLLTGKRVSDQDKARLEQMKAELLFKQNMDWESVAALLSGNPLPKEKTELSFPADTSELVLRMSLLQSQLVEMAAVPHSSRYLRGEDVAAIKSGPLQQAALFQHSIVTAFNIGNKALDVEASSLKRMSYISEAAIVGSLCFLALCVILVLAKHYEIGAASGLFSLISGVVGRFVFGRVDAIRKSIASQEKESSSLYNSLSLFGFCQSIGNAKVRDTTIAALVSQLSGAANNEDASD
jgi:CheY-like chemotaxis protein